MNKFIKFLDGTTMDKDIFLNELLIKPHLLEKIEQNEAICIEAVKQNGYTLEFVKTQTEQICLEAVKQNGFALYCVLNQTEQICLEAVKQKGWALKFVKKQTEKNKQIIYV